MLNERELLDVVGKITEQDGTKCSGGLETNVLYDTKGREDQFTIDFHLNPFN
jgi:hypothetical protein